MTFFTAGTIQLPGEKPGPGFCKNSNTASDVRSGAVRARQLPVERIGSRVSPLRQRANDIKELTMGIDDSEITEILKMLVAGSIREEPCVLADLIKQTSMRHLDLLATADTGKQAWYLVFLAGIPEGAIYIDRDGVRFGDSAVLHIPVGCRFTPCTGIQRDLLEALVMGCRIYDKSHLTHTGTADIPELGLKSSGLGTVTLVLVRNSVPAAGLRVDLMDRGRIVGSDYTSPEGIVSFRVLHGTYVCCIEDKNHTEINREILFEDANPRQIIEL